MSYSRCSRRRVSVSCATAPARTLTATTGRQTQTSGTACLVIPRHRLCQSARLPIHSVSLSSHGRPAEAAAWVAEAKGVAGNSVALWEVGNENYGCWEVNNELAGCPSA